jgi:integrase
VAGGEQVAAVHYRTSAGMHFMQVSKWLGHSMFTLTLDTYGDWIPEADGGVANSLPEPTAPAQPAQATILPFHRESS